MRSAASWLLPAAAVAASLAVRASAQVCSATGSDRSDCYPWTTNNLTESKCLAHGCCWDPTPQVQGVPWCFYPNLPTPAAAQCNAVTTPSRVDCHPEPDADQDSCEARGCCWNTDGPSGMPACFFPRTVGLVPATALAPTATGFSQTLQWGDARRGPFGNDPSSVTADFVYETPSRLRVRMHDPSEAYTWDVTPLVRAAPPATTKAANPQYMLKSTGSSSTSWGFEVTRASSQQVLWNSTASSLFGGVVFEKQFIELSTALDPNDHLYGLGEHVAPLEIPTSAPDGAGQTYTIFSRDRGTPDHSSRGNTNLYGAHPILYRLNHQTGEASAIVLLSSNAMDVIVQPGALTFRIIGGLVDLYILTGPTPLQVSQQYAELVGLPGMPPYFALGFHLCRWGYNNATYWDSIVQGMTANDMPVSAYWHDIDLFNQHRDFTMDPVNFPQSQMGPIIADLIAGGVHYGGIVDPAIECDLSPGQYAPLDQGNAADVWIRDADGQGYAVAGVWPGPCYFPDFFNNDTLGWWIKQHQAFHPVTNFSFLWYGESLCSRERGTHSWGS
jgi:hypothetical protein